MTNFAEFLQRAASPGETLPSKRFALSLPAPEDPEFVRIQQLLIDTVTRAAIGLRVQCAAAHNISFWQTETTITPDPDRPNVVTVTARPRAIVAPWVPDDQST